MIITEAECKSGVCREKKEKWLAKEKKGKKSGKKKFMFSNRREKQLVFLMKQVI